MHTLTKGDHTISSSQGYALNNISSFFRSLGAYLCKHLAKNGYDVAVADLNGDNAISVADEINAEGGTAKAYKVNCLVSKGYVTKVTSDEDRREFLLHVSDRFYNYYDTRSSFIQDACDRLREEFTAEELDTFEKMLWSLNKAVRPGASKSAEENNGR